MEQLNHPLRNVLHIGRPGLKILVLHLGKHFCKIIPRDGCRVLGVDLLGFHQVPDGVVEIVVLQHHGLHLENRSVDLPDLFERLLIESRKFCHRLCPGLFIAQELCLHVVYAPSLHHLLLFCVEQKPSDGNSLKD